MNSCSFFVFRESTQPHEGHRWVRSPLYRTPLNMIPPCAGDRYVESLCSGHRWVRIHPVQDTAELEFTLCRQDTAELEFTLCRNTAELHIESTLDRVQDTAELESTVNCTWHRWAITHIVHDTAESILCRALRVRIHLVQDTVNTAQDTAEWKSPMYLTPLC